MAMASETLTGVVHANAWPYMHTRPRCQAASNGLVETVRHACRKGRSLPHRTASLVNLALAYNMFNTLCFTKECGKTATRLAQKINNVHHTVCHTQARPISGIL